MKKLLLAALLGSVALLPFAGANIAQADPPGNNGHIQLCETGTDFKDCSDALPQNDPFLGCSFDLQFFNYDEGDLSASYTVTSWAPTGNNSDVVASADDIAIGGSPADGSLDAQVVVSPDFTNADVTPQHFPAGPGRPEGDYAHVKVDIHADGSQGADVKHHTVWVRTDCGETPPPPVSNGGITITAGDCTNPVFNVTVENTGDEVLTVDVFIEGVDPLQQPSNSTLNPGESDSMEFPANDGDTITVTLRGTESDFSTSASATADLSGCVQGVPNPPDGGNTPPSPGELPTTL